MGKRKQEFDKEVPAKAEPKVTMTEADAWASLKPEHRAWIQQRQAQAARDKVSVRTQPWERGAPREKPPSNPKQTPRQTGKPTPEKYRKPARRVDNGK